MVTRNLKKAGGLLLVLSALASTALAFPGSFGVPEIDPGSMSSALALLFGGLMLFASGRSRK